MELSLKVKMEELGVELDRLADETIRDMAAAVQTLSGQVYEKAIEMTSGRLHSTRLQYINALHLESEGPGVYTVFLDPMVNHLEDGYDTFQMLPNLARGPASKIAKDGSRYTIIPMRHTTAPANVKNVKQMDLASRLKDVVRQRRFEKVKEGVSAKTGKYTTVERLRGRKDDHPYFKGMVRVREYANQESAKKLEDPVSSAYFTFRTASTKQEPSKHWVHPGFKGAKIFPDLGEWAELQLEQIINELAL